MIREAIGTGVEWPVNSPWGKGGGGSLSRHALFSSPGLLHSVLTLVPPNWVWGFWVSFAVSIWNNSFQVGFDLQLSFVFWLWFVLLTVDSRRNTIFSILINIYFYLFFYFTWETLQSQTFVKKMVWYVGKMQGLEPERCKFKFLFYPVALLCLRQII